MNSSDERVRKFREASQLRRNAIMMARERRWRELEARERRWRGLEARPASNASARAYTSTGIQILKKKKVLTHSKKQNTYARACTIPPQSQCAPLQISRSGAHLWLLPILKATKLLSKEPILYLYRSGVDLGRGGARVALANCPKKVKVLTQ